MKRIITVFLIGSLILTSALAFAGCSNSSSSSSSSSNTSTADQITDISFLRKDAQINKDTEHKAGYQLEKPKDGEQVAIIHTSMGDVSLRLFPENAPKTVQNFIDLAKAGKYDGCLFHRVIDSFMIQTGDYENANGTGGKSASGSAFEDEFCDKLFNLRGAVAMANSGKDTNGSQFFINQTPADKFAGFESLEANWKTSQNIIKQCLSQGYSESDIENISGLSTYNTDLVPAEVKELYNKNGGNPYLDGAYSAVDKGHTVFAQVYDGMDVVDKIAKVKVDSSDKPTTDVTISSVEITTYKA